MPDIVATLNTYCPKAGRCASTLVLYSDGSTRLFGDRSLSLGSVGRLKGLVVPEDEAVPQTLNFRPVELPMRNVGTARMRRCPKCAERHPKGTVRCTCGTPIPPMGRKARA